MRRWTLVVALSVALGGCFEIGRGVMPSPSPVPSPVRAMPSIAPSASPPPTLAPLPLPRLPFVRRLGGEDRLYLFDALSQEVIELSHATTGGPILNPQYFEVKGEPRILFNSGAVLECPERSGRFVPDFSEFGAYVYDPLRRLRYRFSEDDYFLSVVTADGRLFAHLDMTVFPPPRDVSLILEGEDDPFDKEVIVAELDQQPGTLVDIAMAAEGRWLAAVKGPILREGCAFPPLVNGFLYLYDLLTFRLSGPLEVASAQSVALSPTGQQIVVLAGEWLLRLDRVTGELDAMSTLNQAKGEGRFSRVRFLPGSEHVFYFEYRPPGGRSRILAYDWQAQRLNPLTVVNQVAEDGDLYLAPPHP